MKVSCLPSLLVLSLLSASGAALADDAAMADHAMLKCRALGDAQARLACYDTIPVGVRPAAPAVAAAAAAAPAASPEQRFGMEAVKPKEAEPQSIESRIAGKFDGWEPGAQIHLANGQVWRVVDGSSAVLPHMDNAKVKVVRNLLGTLFLEIEGTNNSPKVKRVR
jgi:nucleoid-associated protein YgaU